MNKNMNNKNILLINTKSKQKMKWGINNKFNNCKKNYNNMNMPIKIKQILQMIKKKI